MRAAPLVVPERAGRLPGRGVGFAAPVAFSGEKVPGMFGPGQPVISAELPSYCLRGGLGQSCQLHRMPRMSRTPQFSWPVRVLPGLAKDLAQGLTNGDRRVTAEEVRAELARTEEERGRVGQAITAVLREYWEDSGDFFFGPCSYLVYSHGQMGLRQEMRRLHLSHAARRRARQHAPCP